MGGDDMDAGHLEANVLDIVGVAVHHLGLVLDRHRVPTKRTRGASEKGFTNERQSLERIVTAGFRSMAIGPFIVTWGVEHGSFN